MKKFKRGALEMSVGTIVTMVLLMVFLVLGIFFIYKMRNVGTTFIDGVDTKVQTEIDNLFAQEGSKIVTYPREREIVMDQGDEGGFGFSVENKDTRDGTFSYAVSVEEISSGCQLTEEQAESLIVLGKSGSRILGSGAKFDEAVFVKFSIPETAPICTIRYGINIEKDGSPYASASKDIAIK